MDRIERDEFGILVGKLDLITTLLAAQIGADLPISERAPLLSALGHRIIDGTDSHRLLKAYPQAFKDATPKKRRGRSSK